MSLFRTENLPHLRIPQSPHSPERYKRPGIGGTPPQGANRPKVAKDFEVAIARVEQEFQLGARQLPKGIEPHLVVKMPLYAGVNPSELEAKLDRAGLEMVSLDSDKSVVVAFRTDGDLSAFKAAVKIYETPNANSKSTVFDVLEWVKGEEMRSISPSDRIGERLAQQIGAQAERIEDSEVYPVLDVELLARGVNALTAQKDLEDIRQLLDAREFPRLRGEAVLDTYAGASMCLARVRFSGARLRALLNMSLVASVDFPPQPKLSKSELLGTDMSAFAEPPPPPENGPRLGILDSGITSGHPLLKANLGHEEAFLTATSTIADQHGHGTRVAGIALYGDVADCLKQRNFESPITLYSGRILNANNELDEEKLFVTQIRQALELFTREPYECRVFNISIGRFEEWTPGKQTLWGEALDNLARDYNVLFVVSAGNALGLVTPTRSGNDAELQLARYHACLLEDEWRLCDPATAAIALTVGAIAEADAPFVDIDIRRAVAKANQPAPVTRSGTGVRESMKPDFVGNGGNLVFQGVGSSRGIGKDAACNVTSLSRNVTNTLFSTDIGTSYAAPQIARIAALVEWELWQNRQERPHPNLVRAVMATAATIPEETRELFGADEVHRVCGYGRIDEQKALKSASNRVLLCAESEVEIDHFTIFRVPALPELLDAVGDKRITIALAFDPPVRARRLDYIGVEMGFKLVRGLSEAQVIDACRKFTDEERKDEKVRDPLSPYQVSMTPKDTMAKANISRKRSTLQCASHCWKRNNSWGDKEEWYLVVRAEDRWAKTILSTQRFAVAVVLEADNDSLYEAVKLKVQVQPRVQVRA